MYLYHEKGIRVRVSYLFKRYSKANNKYLKCYDPKQVLKHIIYYIICSSLWELIALFKDGIEAKKVDCVSEFNHNG